MICPFTKIFFILLIYIAAIAIQLSNFDNFDISQISSKYSDMPGHTARHGGTIPLNILVTAFKPDIVIVSQWSQEVVVL